MPRTNAEYDPDPYRIGALPPADLKVGDKVRYYPVLPDSLHNPKTPSFQPLETVLRSEPWQLGHGEWVVLIEGRAGGVSTQHLQPRS